MGISLHTELDMRVETLGLLYFSHHANLYRKQAVHLFDQMGIDGEAFYAKHTKLYEKYVRTFSKHKQVSAKQELLLEEELSFFGMASLPFLVRKEEGFEISELDRDSLRTMLVRGYEELFEDETGPENVRSTDDFIKLLDRVDIPAEAKWRTTMIYRDPCPYFYQLDQLISENLGAAEKAVQAVRPGLEKLIASFRRDPDKFTDRYIIQNPAGITDMYPLLIMPFSQLLVGGTGFYGLLWDTVLDHAKSCGSSTEILCSRLKALGDKSKLDILLLLRQGTSYNQEIASKLKLTPATVSYHMDTLTSCALVDVERRERRIYYSLRLEKMQEIVEGLNKLFFV